MEKLIKGLVIFSIAFFVINVLLSLKTSLDYRRVNVEENERVVIFFETKGMFSQDPVQRLYSIDYIDYNDQAMFLYVIEKEVKPLYINMDFVLAWYVENYTGL
jgi:hypothetical protein